MPGYVRTLGGHQPPDAIPDDLAPGGLPSSAGVPVDGKSGPFMAPLIDVDAYEKHTRAIEELGRLMGLQTRPDFVWVGASGQTDGSGNLVLPLYAPAAGMEARLHRLFLNAAVPATGARYTAASPFSAATAYLELHVADPTGYDATEPSSALGISSQCDSAPTTANTPIFPGVFEYSWHQAPEATGPLGFVLYVVGSATLASTTVQARLGISLQRMKGVA